MLRVTCYRCDRLAARTASGTVRTFVLDGGRLRHACPVHQPKERDANEEARRVRSLLRADEQAVEPPLRGASPTAPEDPATVPARGGLVLHLRGGDIAPLRREM